MEQYLSACEQYQDELERLMAEGAAEHGTLKRGWARAVVAWPAHAQVPLTTSMCAVLKSNFGL
jgi:hypothetical protein